MSNRKAYIYARFSPRPNAAECESDAAQVERCTLYCKMRGFDLEIDPFVDREVSGKYLIRPSLQPCIEAACHSRGVLVCYNMARLARNTRAALEICDTLHKRGADLAFVMEQIDTTTASGKLFFTMMAAFAQFEREQRAEVTSAFMRRHQTAGRRMSRRDRTPYCTMPDPGDPSQLIPHPGEIAAREHAMMIRAMGYSLLDIALALNCMGIDRRGKAWTKASVRMLLRSSLPETLIQRSAAQKTVKSSAVS